MLRARLKDSTNEMVLENFTMDCLGECFVEDGMFYIKNENGRLYTALHRTSLIQSHEIEDNTLIVHTLNSRYEYEMLEGTQEEFEKELSNIRTDNIKKVQEERNKQYKSWTIESKNGFVGKLHLKETISYEKACEYIKQNPVEVGINEFAYRVLGGVDDAE